MLTIDDGITAVAASVSDILSDVVSNGGSNGVSDDDVSDCVTDGMSNGRVGCAPDGLAFNHFVVGGTLVGATDVTTGGAVGALGDVTDPVVSGITFILSIALLISSHSVRFGVNML
jgi:hypothetical protein